MRFFVRSALLLCCCVLACSPDTPPQRRTPPAEPPAASTQAATPAPPKAPAVAGPKLMPVDEASREPSLLQFRNDLLAAVRAHDSAKVLAALDPKIRTSFGAGGGIEAFKRQWKLDQPDSPLWSEMEQILTLGGTFQKGGDVQRFWAPYVYSAWPDRQDAFEALAVIDKDVPLHRSNDAASESIATLEYDIVTRVGDAVGGPLRHVRTTDGRKGWVDATKVRSPIGYRAGLARSANSWKIEALVAGD